MIRFSLRRLASILLMLPCFAFACGLHQSTGFSLVTLPGSLDVFGSVINARQQDRFANQSKPVNFQLFTVRGYLKNPSEHRLEFVVFEAIRGHASDVSITGDDTVNIEGKNSEITDDELVVISEWDVLDAIASGKVSWQQAFDEQWVVLLGPEPLQQQFIDWVQAL